MKGKPDRVSAAFKKSLRAVRDREAHLLKLRQPRWRKERNAHIRREYKGGQTAKSLGHEFGLSMRHVYRIVAAG